MNIFKHIIRLCLVLFLAQCEVAPSIGKIYRPNTSAANTVNESKEFAELYARDQINKTQTTAEVLSYLLNENDPNDPNTAIVIENTSSCDIIVRIVQINGNHNYNLPVSRNSKNHLKIAKGNYTLRAHVCDAKYYSQKNISQAVVITISRK